MDKKATGEAFMEFMSDQYGAEFIDVTEPYHWMTEPPRLIIEQKREGELEWFQSLFADLKAGNIKIAIESVEGAIAVLQRAK